MQQVKAALGVIGALLPIAYCGGMIYYFVGNVGSVQDAEDMGLGPTLLGLAVVGAFFCIPLMYRIYKLLFALRPAPGKPRSNANERDGESDFDPDAAIARYMAKQSQEAAAQPARPSPEGAPRPTFGRRT